MRSARNRFRDNVSVRFGALIESVRGDFSGDPAEYAFEAWRGGRIQFLGGTAQRLATQQAGGHRVEFGFGLFVFHSGNPMASRTRATASSPGDTTTQYQQTRAAAKSVFATARLSLRRQ
jgi:hypothetical protein